MELVPWKNDYSVNIREIDNQHKKLISIINELNENIIAGNDNASIEKILNELVEYTAYHFNTEEKYLVSYNYPETTSHMKQHSALIDNLKDYIAKYRNGSDDFAPDLLNFLKNWLTNHIVGSDKKYSSHLNKSGFN